MEIEYPDKSIHKVDCYRFCKARLNDGEEVYFIEYKDFFGKSNGEFVDSYAIINHSNGKWYKTERKIDYYTLFSHVVEEIDPGILGNRMNFRNESYAHSQSDGYIRTQRDYEEEKNELQIQTEPKREEIPPRNPNDENIRNNGHSENDGYIRTQRDYEEEKMELQTQTEPKRGEIPPRNPNDENIRIGEQIKVKNSADEYELQTQTEPKREGIPPRKPPVERPIEENTKVVYVVLPTIDGKEEKIDFNKIQSQPHFLSYMPTDEMVKMRYNYTRYNYTNEYLLYISCEIPVESSKQIITWLDQLSKQDNFSIHEIPDLSIKGYRFQFIHSNNYKYSCSMDATRIYLPPKMGHKIDKKDMFQRFMSDTAAGIVYNKKDNIFEMMGPILKDSTKAELFSLLMTNSRIKSLVEGHRMKDISSIPRDGYELDEVTAELMMQNFIIGLQINMSAEEREDFRKKTKDINNLEDLRKFISNTGIKIPQGLSDYQPFSDIEESQSRK